MSAWMCKLYGHVTQYLGTTVDGKQIYACQRCGWQWHEWLSNTTGVPR